jgi:hypothetical protein
MMIAMHNYTTISEAISDLKKRGYLIDFNLGPKGLVLTDKVSHSLDANEFEITAVYRFEGDTNPDDQAVVYAIESKDGHKGILVNGYGISSDAVGEEMVKELSIRHESSAQLMNTYIK